MEHGGSLCKCSSVGMIQTSAAGGGAGGGAPLLLGHSYFGSCSVPARHRSTVASMGGYISEIGNVRSKIEYHFIDITSNLCAS